LPSLHKFDVAKLDLVGWTLDLQTLQLKPIVVEEEKRDLAEALT